MKKTIFMGIGVISILIIGAIVALDFPSQNTEHKISMPRTNIVSALMPEITIEELAKTSDTIIMGKVATILPSQKKDRMNRDFPTVYTDTVIQVEKTLKGSSEQQVIVRSLGGKIENFTVVSNESPTFSVGEEVLLFLTKSVGDTYDLPEKNYYSVTGWKQGKYQIVNDRAINYPDESFLIDELQEKINLAL